MSRTFADRGRHFGTGLVSQTLLADDEIHPTGFPPSALTVQGLPHERLTELDSSSPLAVRRQPPASGPASYRVDLRQFAVGRTFTSTSVATADTVRASFTFPAGRLVAGRGYFVRLEARYRGSEPSGTPGRWTTRFRAEGRRP